MLLFDRHNCLRLFVLCLKCSKSASLRKLTAASWMLEPLGEVGAIFSLQLSS